NASTKTARPQHNRATVLWRAARRTLCDTNNARTHGAKTTALCVVRAARDHRDGKSSPSKWRRCCEQCFRVREQLVVREYGGCPTPAKAGVRKGVGTELPLRSMTGPGPADRSGPSRGPRPWGCTTSSSGRLAAFSSAKIPCKRRRRDDERARETRGRTP